MAVLFVLLSIAGGAFTIHHWKSRRDQLRQELRQLEARLEQRRKENPPVDLQREQARKAWEAEIAARPRVNIDYLDAISNALGESWLEQMQLTPTGANLILLLMTRFTLLAFYSNLKTPLVNTVELNLQRSIELKGNSPTIARAASMGQKIALNITISSCCSGSADESGMPPFSTSILLS